LKENCPDLLFFNDFTQMQELIQLGLQVPFVSEFDQNAKNKKFD
jgi:hypothetical protein